jgi:hypothetical protein
VEDEVDLVSSNFMTGFSEALRYYFILFESLEESFPRASDERLMLERTCARKMINLLACDDSSQIEERQESGSHWATRLQRLGLLPAPFSDEVVDDVCALLKRYPKRSNPTAASNASLYNPTAASNASLYSKLSLN